jgi:predicted amidohydrolase
MKKTLVRKIVYLGIIIIGLAFFSYNLANGQERTTTVNDSSITSEEIFPKTLKVAAVQMRSTSDLLDNISRMKSFILDCATKGVRIVIFPECALSGYFEITISNLTAEQIIQAEKQIAEACREASIYAIIGMPYRNQQKLFNAATVISPEGKIIQRYYKIQLAENWPEPGDQLSVFKIDDVPCSIIICHDERYPELVRLPVLAGAKIIFYISHESGLREEYKLNPYRAQIQARAVENNIYIVQANAPANQDATGSHGQSRIILPNGNIEQEASIFGEDMLIGQLDLSKATRENAIKSLTRGPLRDWWHEGVKRVQIIE